MVNSLILSNYMFAKNVDNNSKLIYMALKKFANNITGICFPSKKKLCELCNISMTTLNKGLKHLVEAGVIKKEYRYRSNFSQTSNKYTITPFMISGEYYFNVRADLLDLGLSVKEVLVYTYLCSVLDQEGYCFPSLKTIAEQCELGLSTVKVAIKMLIEKKLIVKHNQFRADGGKRNNAYMIACNEGFNNDINIKKIDDAAHEEYVENITDNIDVNSEINNDNKYTYETNIEKESSQNKTEDNNLLYSNISYAEEEDKEQQNENEKLRGDIFDFKLSKNAIMVYLYIKMKKYGYTCNIHNLQDISDITGLSIDNIKTALAELDIKKLIYGITKVIYKRVWPINTTPPQPLRNYP